MCISHQQTESYTVSISVIPGDTLVLGFVARGFSYSLSLDKEGTTVQNIIPGLMRWLTGQMHLMLSLMA